MLGLLALSVVLLFAAANLKGARSSSSAPT
jgi:hypothetical protein